MTPSKPVLELVPRIGIPPILFGMTADEVRARMGTAERGSVARASWYCQSTLLLNFSEDGRLAFMEVYWAYADGAAARLGDLMIFDVPAHDLIRTISRAAWARPSWREGGDNVAFHDLDVGFWRPGPPIDEEPEDEYRNGKYWMTVSLARTGYEREKSDSLLARFGEQELRNRRPPEGFEAGA